MVKVEDLMDGTSVNNPSAARSRFAKGSLGRQVIIWFVMMAVTPLIVIAAISYTQSKDTLTQLALSKLDYASLEVHRFVSSWLNYRLMDMASQADAFRNAWLLEYLMEGRTESGKPVKEYVRSPDWQFKLDVTQEHLLTLIDRYDYIEDIFLIDQSGYMMFSTQHAQDHLGSNMLTGPYRNTQFAQAILKTLETRGFHYSDIERYGPFNNQLTSFITAPLSNENNDFVGVLAMQIRLDKVLSLLETERKYGLTHYLVGQDGLLRTPVNHQKNDVLKRVIKSPFNNEQVKQSSTSYFFQGDIQAWRYTGINGEPVFGVSRNVKYLGVEWVLISEIEVKTSLALLQWLNLSISGVVVVMGILAILLSFVLTKRLSSPIHALAKHAGLVSEGHDQAFSAQGQFNEMITLSNAFNHMLQQRKQNEQALQVSHESMQHALERMAIQEQRYRSLVSNIPGVVYRCDNDQYWTMSFISDYAEQMTGYPASDFIENNVRSYASIIHPGDATLVSNTVEQGIKGSGNFAIEYRILNKENRIRWVFERGLVVSKPHGEINYLDGFIMDITPMKETELKLRDAKRHAEEAAKAKADFLAIVSHEIRTPLNGVIGMLGILEKSSLDDDQQNKTRVAKDSANALLVLINDILDFSKIDAGKIELEHIIFNVVELFENTLETVQFKAQEKNIPLILETDEVDHIWFNGDPTRIRQVVTNLVGNALKFTETGSIKVQLRLEHYGNRAKLICMVSDTGIGIPDDKLETLFDSFTQVDTSTTRKYGGTGLGLAICKRLCHLMQGDVWATSKMGEGSQFTFHVSLETSDEPLSLADGFDSAASESSVPHSACMNAKSMESMRILLVDDNDINLMVAEDLLGDIGLSAETASTGLEAVNALKDSSEEEPFDLVLMDCQMPEMDGYEATACIREGKAGERYRSIPIIAMTAHAMQGDREKCLAAGMNEYVSKPIHIDKLREAITTSLGGNGIGE